jgi:hypothetical protein
MNRTRAGCVSFIDFGEKFQKRLIFATEFTTGVVECQANLSPRSKFSENAGREAAAWVLQLWRSG